MTPIFWTTPAITDFYFWLIYWTYNTKYCTFTSYSCNSGLGKRGLIGRLNMRLHLDFTPNNPIDLSYIKLQSNWRFACYLLLTWTYEEQNILFAQKACFLGILPDTLNIHVYYVAETNDLISSSDAVFKWPQININIAFT